MMLFILIMIRTINLYHHLLRSKTV